MQRHQASGRSVLRPRLDPLLTERIARSTEPTGDGPARTRKILDWMAERSAAHKFQVERIPFDQLDGWSFEAGTGNLVHRSGRFFTVEGLRVSTDRGPTPEWQQPVIKQPEVGILGILVKEFDGVLHCLMQAKMEPGNPNLLQLSPTVQATRSNYTRAHAGAHVRYVDYFTQPSLGRVVTDVLQSEHGSWFYHKSNRNMVVEAYGDVPEHEDFRWISLREIADLLQLDNVVNMDSRTVLACLPLAAGSPGRPPTDDGFSSALARSYLPTAGALHPDSEIRSWFTGRRSDHNLTAERIPLAEVRGWHRTATTIEHEQGRYFDVVAVSVEAASREVSGWTQPLFAPRAQGVVAFLARRIHGVVHVLVHARAEAGFLDTVELGPTVQCIPPNVLHLAEENRPAFLDLVLDADPSRIRYQAVHSEEGGRFLHAESRYLVVEVTDEVSLDPSPEFRWVTPGQLTSLLQHGHYVNVQARSLLACLAAIG